MLYVADVDVEVLEGWLVQVGTIKRQDNKEGVSQGDTFSRLFTSQLESQEVPLPVTATVVYLVL